MRIKIYGTPVAQPRHKVSTIGGFARAYIPEKHKIHAWKALIQDACYEPSLTIPTANYERAIEVELIFTLPRPKSLPKKVTHHIKKPDIDNLCKAVLDAMNGIIYKDDSQVWKLTASKCYGEDVGVEIELL